MNYEVVFREEIEKINIEELQDFVVKSFEIVPEWQLDERDIAYVKATVGIARELCEVLDADDVVYDMFTVAGLLHFICRYDLVDGEKEVDRYHMAKVREYLWSFQSIIGREQFDNIMRVIEEQEGFKSPIPQLAPAINEPAHMWVLPFATHLARKQEG